jgi:glycerol-3-phosphate dehydrogenase
MDNSLHGKHLLLSKGVHIVVPRERLPIRQAAYFDAPDGRMIFAIPRHRTTYIGTTDTAFEGNPDRVSVLREDVEYLLHAANSRFPKAELSIHDVESSWAGLRPLIYEAGKSASETSRKDEIFCSPTGLISIAGGKLTGFRKMAEKVVNLVTGRLKAVYGKNFMISFTDKIPLRGGFFRDAAEVNRYREELGSRLHGLQLPAWRADYLVSNYGRQSEAILEQMPAYSHPPETALACAEAWFAIHQELALEPLDFFERRSGRLYFDLPGIAPVQEAVLAVFAASFQWDQTTLRQKRQNLEEAIFEASCAFLNQDRRSLA